ncbi:hypothetical protein LTR10_014648 [Elasticomyces elasticus]|uniref:BTB domain-containing protein n=1 Tax=Exophiala sideris TaxID=1016849 RepID=A0ABR0JT53_9EURO|nr:hypothetical protein LTR10_014648 [Elasticomyces elasticus]KAK5040626.1 hypothetical protein LTS07_001126 [Exophiala sideris]KAK5042950.1 hypothetical protein LTR13_000720 [Exophiala sideris]KAK5069004.1 hypothetical protein LTR69_001127 [Exophiala sideris]KAK5186601.1 hypothetical protein LTR44_001658 [Eurotiomycetes sp. CCFEE 6388]
MAFRKKSISFSTDMVTLVFEDREEIAVHREILRDCDYIAKNFLPGCGSSSLTSSFVMASPRDGYTIYLGEISKETGNQLVNWLYFGTLPYNASELCRLGGEEGIKIGSEIVEAYNVAMKFEMEDWANALADAFSALALEDMPWIKYVILLKPVQPSDEGLRGLVLTCLALAIRRVGWETYTTEVNKELVDTIKLGGDFAVELMKYLLDTEGGAPKRKKKNCNWHVHTKTKKCGN